MGQKIDFTAVGKVVYNDKPLDFLKLNNKEIWHRYAPVIFKVTKKSKENYTTIEFIVTAGDTDVEVNYEGNKTVIPAGTTSTISYKEDTYPSSGTITFTGDVVRINGGINPPSSKGTDQGLGNITEVVSFGSLQEIGEYLFAKTIGITHLDLPNTIRKIAYRAFESSQIETIKLPDYVTEMGYEIFEGSLMKEFTIPSWLKVIPADMLSRTYITHIVIPEGVTGWGEGATYPGGVFADCTKLESVTFPSTLKDTGYRNFYGCSNLKNVVVPEGIETIPTQCFSTSGLETISLPKSLKVIDTFAFDDTPLTSIVIPENVEKISYTTFIDCASLQSVVFENPNGWVDNNGVAVDFSDPAANVAKLKENIGYYYTRS